ncbi:MAG: Sec-independent protein translocase subunit TatA/TatB [Woeseiaceae bacterium]
MSGLGGSEFLLLCVIGLLILGPERLPRVARQIGSWLGKARQMTRALQRQLEEETDLEKNLGINPEDLHPDALLTPHEDDTYSPLHDEDAHDDDARDGDADDGDADDGEVLTVDDSGEPKEKTA